MHRADLNTEGVPDDLAMFGRAARRSRMNAVQHHEGLRVAGEAQRVANGRYSVVREVGTGCGTRERLVPCVELNALRCSVSRSKICGLTGIRTKSATRAAPTAAV